MCHNFEFHKKACCTTNMRYVVGEYFAGGYFLTFKVDLIFYLRRSSGAVYDKPVRWSFLANCLRSEKKMEGRVNGRKERGRGGEDHVTMKNNFTLMY